MGRLGADSPIVTRLANGGFWSLVGDAGVRMLSFASAIVVARWLGAGEFGAFALIQSTLAMLAVFALFGMGSTTSRFIAALRDKEPERIEGITGLTLRFSALTGSIVAVAIFVAAPVVANSYLKMPQLETQLRMVAPILFFYAISSAMTGTILGFEAFRRMARISWASGIFNFIAVVTGVVLWGLQGAVLGLVVSELIRSLMILFVSHNVMRVKGFSLFARADLSEAKILWQFSLPLLLGSILYTPITWVCYGIITREPGGIIQIGFYGAALKAMTLVTLMPMAVSAAFGPILANLYGGGDKNSGDFKRVTGKLAITQFGLTAIPALLCAMMAPWVMSLFGEEFVSASLVLVILMVLAPVFVLKHMYWLALTSVGRIWSTFWIQCLWAVLIVGATWYWKDQGAIGLAYAVLLSHLIALVASMGVNAMETRVAR